MTVEMKLFVCKGGRGSLSTERAVWALLMPYRGEYVPRAGELVKLFNELELELEVATVVWHSQGPEGLQPTVHLQDLILSPTEAGWDDLHEAAQARRVSGNRRPLPAPWPEDDDEVGQVAELLFEYGWRTT